MKRIYTLFVLAALLAAACSRSESSKRETFTFEKAKFKIAFPKQPEAHVMNAGAFIEQAFVCQDPADSAVTYLVNCTTIPREQLESSEAMTGYLLRVKTNTLANLKALTTNVDREVSEYGSRGVYFEADGATSSLAYKIFFVENRMYSVGVIAPIGKMPSNEVTKAFFDSFEALK